MPQFLQEIVMRGLAEILLVSMLFVSLAQSAFAQTGRSAPKGQVVGLASLGKGNAIAGKAKAEDERCVECHGHDGNANDIEDGVGNIGKFPRLAGQNVEYIVKQFSEFRSGKRNNEIMAVMAKTVSNADLIDIAAYFSNQKPVPGERAGDNPLGKQLFHNGDPARNILACVTCHSGRIDGVATTAPENPVIAGQHRRYLQKQLMEWRAGERTNSPGNVMNDLTRTLSDKEIDALADYVSGL